MKKAESIFIVVQVLGRKTYMRVSPRTSSIKAAHADLLTIKKVYPKNQYAIMKVEFSR